MQSQSAYHQSSSVYFRTIGALTLSSILVFFVLCVASYQRLSRSFITDKYNNLKETIEDVAVRYNTLMENDLVSENTEISQSDMFLRVFSEATGRTVWIVDKSGELLYASAIPDEVRDQLEQDISDIKNAPTYWLPDTFSGKVLADNVVQTDSTYEEFFIDTQFVWVTVSCPIPEQDTYLLLHEKLDVEREAFAFAANGLALPVLISFILSLIAFILISRAFTRPIKLLSEAAARVADGDLSTRIVLPEEQEDSTLRLFLPDELKDMVEMVNHMIERLEQQGNERRVFISGIAHDFRTPLTSIKGFVAASLDGTIPPERTSHYMEIVLKEIDRLQVLTQTMTEVSLLGQKESMKIAPFDVKEMILSTLNGMESFLREKYLAVQLETNTKEDLPILADGDVKAINRVIYNLVNNAIKFTPAHGAICISVKSVPKSNQILVSVEDSGPGIPEDAKNRVFESFFKADESRSDEGSGLGLYICREILKAHEQRIYVEDSQDLGGARLTFTLQMHRKDYETNEPKK